MPQLKRSIAVLLITMMLSNPGPGFAQESLFDAMYESGTEAFLQRRYSEAEKKLKAALREAEQFPSDDARLRKSLKTLAELYDEEKKFDQSEPLYRRLIENDQNAGQAGQCTLAGGYSRLASNLQSQAKHNDAIAAYLKANELYLQAGSAEKESQWPDENRVVTLIKLASACSELGKTADCQKYLREAVSVAQASKDPLNTGKALDELGRHYTTAGRFEEAEVVLGKAASVKNDLQNISMRRLEKANTMMHSSRLFHAQGRIKEALDMVALAYKIRQDYLQENDPRVYEPLVERASIYRDLNCYKEAIAELEKGRALVEKSFGDESPRYAEFLRLLAADYVSVSQYAKADPLLRKALSIDETASGKQSTEVCADLNAIGMYYIYQGKYEDAEPIYRRALAITESKFGSGHVDVAAALNNLAWLYVNQRKFAEARPLIERGLAIREKALGTEHPVVARNLHNLANLAIAEKKFDEAQKLLERTVKIQKSVLGAEHQDTVAAMRDLADLFKGGKKYAEAEDNYKAILKADEKVNDTDSSIIAADLDNLARVLIEQSRGDEAKPFIERARKIKAKLPGYNESGSTHAISIGTLKGQNAVSKAVADKWALVVGISNFKDPAINLKFAAKDAMDFRNYLIFEANFKPDHVKLLVDQHATRDNIVGHLGDKWLGKVAKNDDLVVIYVSSHGTSARKEVGDANFIVAYETNLSNAVLSGIPMQFFTTGVKDLVNCQRVVIIMDVCHGGALRQTSVASAIVARPHQNVEPGSKAIMRQPDLGVTGGGGLAVGSGQIVVASSEADQVSWESKSYPNGVFTRQLIEAMRMKGENTSLQEAYKVMRGKVEQEVLRARAEIQTPIMVTNAWQGGDVVIAVKPAHPRNLSPAPVKAQPPRAEPTGTK